MSSSKPFFASKPRAFMMFQTIGLNTGSVRLDTLIFGLICADAAVALAEAIATAATAAAKQRREILNMSSPQSAEVGCGECFDGRTSSTISTGSIRSCQG